MGEHSRTFSSAMKTSIYCVLLWTLLLSVIFNVCPQFYGDEDKMEILHQPESVIPTDVVPKANHTNHKQDTTKDSWPWAANLGYKDENGKMRLYCKGALIHPNHIITSGGCGFKYQTKENRFVRLEAETKNNPPVDMVVGDIFVHSGYQYPSLYNDLALIHFRGNIESKLPNMRHIQLPFSSLDIKGKMAILTGWVGEDYQSHHLSPMMMELQLCNDITMSFDQLKENFPKGILDGQMCTAFPDGIPKEDCKEEDGGPLVYKNPEDDTFVLVGIAAGGKGCGLDGSPGYYTFIPKYLEWIKEKLKTK